MTDGAAGLWPWVAVLGLGAFHGLNPAMGWLFAVGLGLHRRSRSVTLLSLAPIALGHAASVAAVVVAVVGFGIFVDAATIGPAAGVALIGMSAWHLLYAHRRRVRIGMRTGLAGLALWSFAMATTHGAGLMLVPAVLPLCITGAAGGELAAGGSLPVALAAVAAHTGAMLAVIAAIAVVVYEWIGVAFLRRGWINLDLLWSAALAASGAILLLG
jgi:hypothetical protein